MSRIFIYIAAFIGFMHGLVHVLYFVSCWPIAALEELPYKTTFLNGRWDVGPSGIRLFGLLCLTATLGFIVAAVGLAAGAEWWRLMMAIVAVYSLVATSLDWSVAYGGPVINIIILVLVLVASRLGL